MRRPRWSVQTPRPWALVILIALAVLVVLPLSNSFMMKGSTGASAAVVAYPDAAFTATVTWNGVNINTAATESSALTLNFDSSANVLFNWTSPTPVSVATARLQMIYFGAALVTRDVSSISSIAATKGSAVMNWTPGALVYVLEGVFKITASLLSNGSTVWSENFFVRTNAPYSILAALPILLLVIGAWEVYSVARSGRQAAISRKAAPPSAPPPETPPEPSEPTPPPTEPAPPAEEESK
jgi:hypothetical protein